MKKKRVSLIAAVALVVVGTLALVTYVNKAEDRALAGEELVDVLVLDADVPAGTSANELQQFVRVESVPTKVQAAGALAGISDADGMVVAVDLVQGEQLTQGRLVSAEEFNALQARVGRGGGTVAVPEGLLEITIPLDGVRTVGGTVRPGDLVKIDPEAWSIVDGKLYLNYSESIQEKWDANRGDFIARADQQWPEIGKR